MTNVPVVRGGAQTSVRLSPSLYRIQSYPKLRENKGDVGGA